MQPGDLALGYDLRGSVLSLDDGEGGDLTEEQASSLPTVVLVKKKFRVGKHRRARQRQQGRKLQVNALGRARGVNPIMDSGAVRSVCPLHYGNGPVVKTEERRLRSVTGHLAAYHGEKRVVVTTRRQSWLGARNPILGPAYLAVGCVALLAGAVILAGELKGRRTGLGGEQDTRNHVSRYIGQFD